MTTPLNSHHQLDTQGLCCPEPVMLLHRVMRNAATGEVVHVLATDPSTQRDIPKFCTFLGHDLVHTEITPSVFEYWIRKA
jgi:tRNA 2-thiouridine synthesizing protein A